ncbi:hypothetical protein O181_104900 [Austropuccinia psidii MF-1]|uniref:Uncharacterized protein n=1 Tax=Austropuccinia psidii MF-1 TaxID=1389203 RepID=A0A9Q3JKR2_9BASI|nr:hypothetical protein [Austropuccinia psidii MF-1]
MNSYFHIKSFLGQEKTIELLRGWSPMSFKDKVKKIKNWLKNKSLLSIDQKKKFEMTPALETEAQWRLPAPNQLQKCPRTSPKDLRRSREVPKTIKAKANAKPIGTDLTHKGKGSTNWGVQPWTVYTTWPGL